MDFNIYGRKKVRKPFKISTKNKEWNKSAGRSEDDSKSTSKCRNCKTRLIWGKGGYEFDHKNNDESNNSQKNCYLVCSNCHAKVTRIAKKKKRDRITGITMGYKTIKKKVGYKKQTRRKKAKKKRKKRGIFDVNIRSPF